MSTWKIVVIAFMLGSLVGYSYLQNRPAAMQAPTASQTMPSPDKPEKYPAQALVGKPVPELNISAEYWLNSPRPVKLKALQGSPILLEFWRAGCPHCLASAPFIKGLHERYSKRGLKVVSIHSSQNMDDPEEGNWERIQTRVKGWKFTHPAGYDRGATQFKTVYKGTNFPTWLLIDKAGMVRFFLTGHDEEKEHQIVAMVEYLLNPGKVGFKPAAGKPTGGKPAGAPMGADPHAGHNH